MALDRAFGVGICGLGFMGRQYFSHLREHGHARVVAVCDRDAERRAGKWADPVGNISAGDRERVDMAGIDAYDDWEALIDDERVDVVAVTLPTPTHADVTVQALEAGKHVLCEKPMALTLADCDRMIAAAERVRERSTLLLTVDTLEYLHRGGRIGTAAKFLGSVIQLKPLLEVNHDTGVLEPVERELKRYRESRL